MLKIGVLFFLLYQNLIADPGKVALMSSTTDGVATEYSSNIETLILMSLLPFSAAILVMLTPFLRCIIVFGLLRQALGTMHSPPNQVLIAISLMISFVVMKPSITYIYEQGYQPYVAGEISLLQMSDVALPKLKSFWLSVTDEDELIYFSQVMDVDVVDNLEDLPLSVIIPAFVYSELKTAFKIAFLLFLPFLVIDMVVASILMGMGMMMLSPMIVSLPFKIFAFIALDAFGLVTSSIITSYGGG